MDEVEVEVFKSKIIETPLACRLHVFWSMESIPQLGGDKELVPSTQSSLDRSPDAPPHLAKRFPRPISIITSFSLP